ncbi:MAG: hypothetical protein WBG90_19235 [Saonia sp.]
MKKPIYAFVLIFFLLSCASDSGDSTEPPMPPSDEAVPVISLSNVPKLIEVLTELSVTITDTSNVTSSILIDGEEVFSSSEKSFAFSLDPFDYSIGDKTITVRTMDENGNEASANASFELKKLLVDYPNPLRDVLSDIADSYLAINDDNGALIMYRKVESEADGVFYADDNFERQHFTFTRYRIQKDPVTGLVLDSFGNIEPGTRLLSDEEIANRFPAPFPGRDTSLDITVNSTKFAGVNTYHSILYPNVLPGLGNYSLEYASEVAPNFLMTLSPPGIFEASEYLYLFIDDLSKLVYEEADFKAADTFATVTIPEGDSFNLSLLGFKNEMDYRENKYQVVYGAFDYLNGSNDQKEVPILPEFDLYEKRLILERPGGKTLFLQQKGIDTDFSIPNLDISATTETVNIIGDYDFIRYNLIILTPLSGGGSGFFWEFTDRPTSSDNIPFLTNFVFPEEIAIELSSKGIETNPTLVDPGTYVSRLFKYESPVDYTSLIFTGITPRSGSNNSFRLQLNLEE